MRPLHLELEIDVREQDGSCRRRRITVKHFQLEEHTGQVLLGAHCASSGQFQQFSGACIEGCRDPANGMAIDDLPALLLARYNASRQGRIEHLSQQLASELAVLLAVGSADRLLQRAEKELMASFLHRHHQPLPGVEPLSEAEIATALRWISPPDAQQLARAAEALASRDRAWLEQLYGLCLALADVRPAREGDEQSALDLLRARWFAGG
jgi:hypothetical protein